jgi:phage terminase large subunit-like protein
MLRLGTFPRIITVTHGGQKKVERIAWALEGRFEHGRLWFRKDAEYLHALESQLLDFPNPLSHDDLIDSLAYIDQLAETDWEPADDEDEWGDNDFDMNGRNKTTGY